jgi:hypothetical protein
MDRTIAADKALSEFSLVWDEEDHLLTKKPIFLNI